MRPRGSHLAPDEEKADGHGNTEGDIDQELHEQVARDAVARIVHRPSRGADASLADEPDEPAAEIFALQKHEDDEQNYQPGGAQRPEQRRDDDLQKLERIRLRSLDDLHRLARVLRWQERQRQFPACRWLGIRWARRNRGDPSSVPPPFRRGA